MRRTHTHLHVPTRDIQLKHSNKITFTPTGLNFRGKIRIAYQPVLVYQPESVLVYYYYLVCIVRLCIIHSMRGLLYVVNSARAASE